MQTCPIEFDHLHKRYGQAVAVRDLVLRIGAGEVVCLLGPNGAGKTTSVHTLMGLRNPTGGDVRIFGVSVLSNAIHAARRRVGFLSDQPALYEYLTGREYIEFVAELYGVDATQRCSIDAWLGRLELTSAADSLIKTYSLGMRKKVAFIAALVHDPDVLVLDEPTGGLDAANARVVKDVMAEWRAAGKSVLMTTHVMEIAERVADRIAIIVHGELIADTTLAELRTRHGRGGAESLEDIFLRLTQSAKSRGDVRLVGGTTAGTGTW